ncbi:hypothetical protein HNQ92_001851 [Rhabdobacter roseus]|uniref:Uncharacterized protein n=1 Tax=Rhabdobacter roseus TaxID=1655419 RepID=A0A840TLB0_9BACT|nr:hypothetical protein [Rhabdobacter roseus]
MTNTWLNTRLFFDYFLSVKGFGIGYKVNHHKNQADQVGVGHKKPLNKT